MWGTYKETMEAVGLKPVIECEYQAGDRVQIDGCTENGYDITGAKGRVVRFLPNGTSWPHVLVDVEPGRHGDGGKGQRTFRMHQLTKCSER